MLSKSDKEQIVALIKKEVVPSIGCTEPIAVALCVAKATETLGAKPEKIDIYLSANILKNAMGVGIPGTGMIGLPIAIALGASIGKSEYGLEVLKNLKPEDVSIAKQWIEEKRIHIALKEDIENMLYIEVHCFAKNETSVAIIKDAHTHFTYIAKNEQVLLDIQSDEEKETSQSIELTFGKVYEFAMTSHLEDIDFILAAAKMNRIAAKKAESKNYGHSVAKTISGTLGKQILGNSIYSRMLSNTAAACDARMDGAMIPVMSNSGSGNQGIAATLPVLSYAQETNKSEEELIRALMLSNLTVIYIKQKLGRLSALCGCVAAATGASCGITYLMGGNYEQLAFAIKNMVGNITGMICDGAKPSCALKISSGVSTALLSAIMAIENKVVSSMEGIVEDDVDKTIDNLCKIGSLGMKETDKIVLDIMTSKK